MNIVITVLYLASLLLSAVMAFIFRRELKGRYIIVLLPYLIYVFVQETTLIILIQLKYVASNSLVYNIYRPVSVIVFAFMYYSIPLMASLRRLVAGLTIVYVLITLINYCFIESVFTTSSYLPIARGFLITFFAVLFLFRYFSLDNINEETYWRPLVWITAGIALFYPVVTISLAFQKYLAQSEATLFGLRLYQMIPQVMSIFMYNCFSYAFYLCQKIK